jgi:hypothetical protein
MMEIKRMIENGELTVDALKWKIRKEGYIPGLDCSIGGLSTQLGTLGTPSCLKAENGDELNL